MEGCLEWESKKPIWQEWANELRDPAIRVGWNVNVILLRVGKGMKKIYQASTAEGAIDFINMRDLEIAAEEVIPKGGYGYISSGAGDIFTYQENERAFNHKLIIPHVLKDIELPDTTLSLGDTLSAPTIMAPVAAHGLANVAAEQASAKGVSLFGTIYTASSYASCTLEETEQLVVKKRRSGSNFIWVKTMASIKHLGDGKTQWRQSDRFDRRCNCWGTERNGSPQWLHLSVGNADRSGLSIRDRTNDGCRLRLLKTKIKSLGGCLLSPKNLTCQFMSKGNQKKMWNEL